MAIDNVSYRIVDFDTWFQRGQTNTTTPHVTIMPDSAISHSPMHNTGLTEARTKIETYFGPSYILSHASLLSNAVTNGLESGVA